jgi:hypothetical protein
MTMWELSACVDGVNFANDPEGSIEPPSNDEFDQMLVDYDHLIATPH